MASSCLYSAQGVLICGDGQSAPQLQRSVKKESFQEIDLMTADHQPAPHEGFWQGDALGLTDKLKDAVSSTNPPSLERFFLAPSAQSSMQKMSALKRPKSEGFCGSHGTCGL